MPDGATKCGHCGSKLAKPNDTRKTIIQLVVVFGLLIAAVAWYLSSLSSSPSSSDRTQESLSQCHSVVRQKSPTGTFEASGQAILVHDGNQYHVTGELDGKLYNCVLTSNGSGWTVDSYTPPGEVGKGP